MSVAEAAASGDVERLRALLEAGNDPDGGENGEDWTPLQQAAFHDHVEAARLLLDAGADIYASRNGTETPLLMAGQFGKVGVFRLLVERGYRLDVERDNAGWMLIEAASLGKLEIVRWLLAHGVNVDATDHSGCTALTRAAAHDQLETVEELLRAGANPNHRDHDTETVLMWAADHPGNAAVLRALLKAGADVNARSNVEGTALTWVVRKGHGDPEMAEVLLEAGAHLDASIVLIRAAMWGFVPIVRMLIERGVDTGVTDVNGHSALDVAKIHGHREVSNLLHQAEADRMLRETGGVYPPPLYRIGAYVRSLTGTPREGWIVRAIWHHKHARYYYLIEVEGATQPRKNVSRKYWDDELEPVADGSDPVSLQ